MKLNFFSKANFFCFLTVLAIFFFDRITKINILILLKDKDYIFINDFLNLNLVFNTGIGFGLLSLNAGIYYNIISLFILLVILILIYLLFKSKGFEKHSFSLIIGGALGNLYDRIFYKAVPDFIDFHYENFHWFIFNVADIFITVGVVSMIILETINNNKQKHE